MVFHWKRGRREMEHEQVRGWRGGGKVVIRKGVLENWSNKWG